jgi:phosphoserine phosphatase
MNWQSLSGKETRWHDALNLRWAAQCHSEKRCKCGKFFGTLFKHMVLFRLEVMQLTRQQLEAYIKTNPIKLTPGIQELVTLVQHKQNADVFLVSGGFRELIEPVADLIGIPRSHIYANRLLFRPNGEYLDFDRNEPTSDSGSRNVGKARVCALLKEA